MSARADAQLAVIATGVPRLALTREEAAQAIGMSLNSFERHVQPEVRLVRRGKLRLVTVVELQRWLEENEESVFGRGRVTAGRAQEGIMAGSQANAPARLAPPGAGTRR